MRTARHLARVSLGVALCVGALRVAAPEADARAELSYLFVLTLGYAHLLGALLGGARSLAAALPPALASPAGLFALVAAVPLLLHAHGVLASHWPPFLGLLLAISTWHACENECALARARNGRLAPLRTGWRDHALPAATTALLLALAAGALPADARAALGPLGVALPDLSARGIHVADVFAASTLFHLLSWLEVSARRQPRLVLAVHLGAAIVCGASLALPGPLAAGARGVFFSPGLYLFWSALHVGQTTLARRGARDG